MYFIIVKIIFISHYLSSKRDFWLFLITITNQTNWALWHLPPAPLHLHKPSVIQLRWQLYSLSGRVKTFTAFHMALQHSWSGFFSPTPPPPNSFASSFLGQVGRGCICHSCTPAHSFMSDTELSHCEQFLCGLMLTNELSSASSEKSSQRGDGSRRFNSVRRETTALYTVCTTQSYFNGDCGFKWRGSRDS